MSKRPAFYLIKGGLTEERHGIYRLRERQAAASAAERWPWDGEWRRLIRSLIRNPTKGE
jgi:hypothetical protein